MKGGMYTACIGAVVPELESEQNELWSGQCCNATVPNVPIKGKTFLEVGKTIH